MNNALLNQLPPGLARQVSEHISKQNQPQLHTPEYNALSEDYVCHYLTTVESGNDDQVNRVLSEINRDCFTEARRHAVYDSVVSLKERGESINLVTVHTELLERKQFEAADYFRNMRGDDWPEALTAIEAAKNIKLSAMVRNRVARVKNIVAKIHGQNLNGNTAQVFTEAAVEILDIAESFEAIAKPTFDLLGFDDLLNIPDTVSLQKLILLPGSTFMIAGESTVGKTFVVIDWIVNAIAGKKWANEFEFDRPLKVIYCTNEGRSGLKNRFIEAIDQNNIDKQLLRQNFKFMLDVPQLFDASHPKAARKFIADIRQSKFQPDIVWIDTLVNASAGGNLNNDWSIINDTVDLIKRELDCCVGLVHHKSHKANGGDNGPMGLSYIKGNMDTLLELDKKRDGTVIRFTKIKDGEAP